MFDNAFDYLDRALDTAGAVPKLLAKIKIERGDDARGLCRLHALDDKLGGSFRQSCKDAATMKPAHALAKDRRPVKVTRLELSRSLVRAIVKDNRWPDSVTAIAVDGRNVGPGNSVMLKPFIKRADSHGFDTRGDQFADGIVHHGRHYAGVEAKAV